MHRTTVLVVDGHQVFAEVLAARLAAEEDVHVVGTANSARDALSAVRRLRPNVVIVELDLAGYTGIELATTLRDQHPDVAVVVLTAADGSTAAVDAVLAGAVAWVPKRATLAELLAAIRAAKTGAGWVPSEVLGPLLRGLAARAARPDPSADAFPQLTSREREVLQCLVDGLDANAVAARLFLSKNTVRTHVQNLLAKLDAHSQLDAVVTALRAGMRPGIASPTG